MTRALRVLIVDDEPLAIQRLEIGLADIPDAVVVGAAQNAEAAARAIAGLRPDVVLLDIRMPGLDGLQLLETLDPATRPAVIFVTAYSQFALDAFKVAAVDYLIKPVEFSRLAQALDRARSALDAEAALRRARQDEPPAKGASYADEIWIQAGGVRRRVAVDSIEWIEAERDYVRIHAAGRADLIRRSIASLIDALDPAAFGRAHRSALVRLDQVISLNRGEAGGLLAVMRSGAAVPISRRHAASFKAKLEGSD